MLETLLASVGLPILLDLVKSAAPALSRKFVGISVDDQIKINNSDTDRLKVLAELDTPGGTPSQWVINLRAAFRYIFSAMLVLVGAGLATYGAVSSDQELVDGGLQIALAPGGFILGERMVLSFKAGAK